MSCAVPMAQLSETQEKGKAGRPRRLPGGGSTELGLEGQVTFRHGAKKQRWGSRWEWAEQVCPRHAWGGNGELRGDFLLESWNRGVP